MLHRYLDSLLSGRTITLTALVAVFVAFYLSAERGAAGANSWDALFPALTETSTVGLLGLLWWVSVLIPHATALSRPEALLRHGSRIRAVFFAMKDAAVSLAAGVSAILTLAATVWAFSGHPMTWSPLAEHAASSRIVPSAFSATALAQHLPNPVLAATLCVVFTCAGFLAVAFVFFCVAARLGSQPAAWSLIGLYLWAAISSFEVLPGLDVSGVYDLPWALSTSGAVIPLIVLAVCCGAAVLLVAVPRSEIRSRLAGRGTIAALLAALAGVTAWACGTGSSDLPEGLRSFLGGEYADLEQYTLTAALSIGYALGYASRLNDYSADNLLVYQALRSGSWRRWTITSLSVELGHAALYAVAITLIVGTVIGIATGFTGLDSAATWLLLLRALLGIWAETALMCAAAMLSLWLTGATSPWLALAAVSLALGYPIVLNLGPANIFSPFSIQPGTPMFGPTTPLIACAAAAAAVLTVTVTRSSLPRGLTPRPL